MNNYNVLVRKVMDFLDENNYESGQVVIRNIRDAFASFLLKKNEEMPPVILITLKCGNR